MSETKPIPVRLDDNILMRLDKAANRIGNNRAGIIRLLINSWLDDYESKGMAVLPPDWKNLMLAQDHRTRQSKGFYPAPAPDPMVMHEKASNSASAEAKHLLGSILNAGLDAAEQRAASKRRRKGKAPARAKAAPPAAEDQNC